METCAHCGAEKPLAICAQCPEQEVLRQKLCFKCLHKHADMIHAHSGATVASVSSLKVGEKVTAEKMPVTKSLIDNPQIEPGFAQVNKQVVLYWPTPKDSECGGQCGATEMARCRDYETAQRIVDALKECFEVCMYGRLQRHRPRADYVEWVARIARMKKTPEVDHTDLQNDEAMDRLIQEARDMTGDAPAPDEE